MLQLVVVSVVVAGIAVYYLGIAIYRLFFSPLAKLPGPWLTRVSTVLEANALKRNARAAWVTSLFEANPGAIAIRTGPNAVSFNHPDAVKAIYGYGKSAEGFGKSSHYDAFSTTDESLFSTRSKKRHAIKRRMVAHGFSAQSLSLFEPLVDDMLVKFMTQMDQFASRKEPFDIYSWFELFTMDLLGELALGSNFGAIDRGNPGRYGELVEQSQRFANYASFLPFGKWNVKVLSKLPIQSVQDLYQARLDYLDFSKSALERRFNENREGKGPMAGKARQDILERFVEGRDPETGQQMGFNELRAETSSLMVAGASTGSVTMNWMTYYLCKNPDVKRRLTSELEAMFPDNIYGSTPLPFTKLQRLSLLEHAEIECLRLHPPIAYAMPRDTPPQGAVIAGIYIPHGVAVGVPAIAIGMNPSVYPSPHTWDPDRWSGKSPNSGNLSTMKNCFLGFGSGSRQCIGKNVASQFMMKMVGQLLLRYDVEMEDPSLVLGCKEFTILKPDKRFRVILKRRGGQSEK